MGGVWLCQWPYLRPNLRLKETSRRSSQQQPGNTDCAHLTTVSASPPASLLKAMIATVAFTEALMINLAEGEE